MMALRSLAGGCVLFAIARVVCEDFLAEGTAVDVHIDFGGSDALVTQHLLNGAQVCPTLEQMGSK